MLGTRRITWEDGRIPCCSISSMASVSSGEVLAYDHWGISCKPKIDSGLLCEIEGGEVGQQGELTMRLRRMDKDGSIETRLCREKSCFLQDIVDTIPRG